MPLLLFFGANIPAYFRFLTERLPFHLYFGAAYDYKYLATRPICSRTWTATGS